jgi:aspartate/methionine/tyrosine aminotransferase
MERIVSRCEAAGAYLLSDEVYRGAEIDRERSDSFWGMGERVVVTSGLSKAYGIPGVRIGWIAGPPDVVEKTWTQHDYLTIGPNKLSDALARVAVRPENREKLYARARALLKTNLPVVRDFARSLEGFVSLHEPEAGAICLLRYESSTPSVEIAERIRVEQSTLIVPGSQLGLEGHLRIWIGARRPSLDEGLRRIAAGLELVRATR